MYALRYWLITAVCAVIGLGAGLTYGLLTKRQEGTVFDGSIAVCGISAFYGEIADITDSQVELYNNVEERALADMSSQQVRTALYADYKSEWETLTRKSSNEARTAFFEALTVQQQSSYVYVAFRQVKDGEKESAFSIRVINSYLEKARGSAVSGNPMLAENNRLLIRSATQVFDDDAELSRGLVMSSAVGVLIGILLGLAAVLILYFADRRVTAYGDIAAGTGKKLLGVSNGAVTNKVCPRIDCEMGDGKVLLICGDEEGSRRLADLYAEYAQCSGRSVLRIDFTRSEGGEATDTFGAFLRGESLETCATHTGEIPLLHGEQSWAMALTYSDKIRALKEKFGRVVVSAPFRDDGSLGVLAKIGDKVAYVVHQKNMRISDMLRITQETQCEEKAIGAVLEYVGKGYVGGSVYVPEEIEE